MAGLRNGGEVPLAVPYSRTASRARRRRPPEGMRRHDLHRTARRYALRARGDRRPAGDRRAARLRACEPDLVDAVLEEAGKLARDVLAPLNVVGDREGTGSKTAWFARRPGSATPTRTMSRAAGTRCPSARALAARACPSASRRPCSRCGTRPNMGFALCPLLNDRRGRAAPGARFGASRSGSISTRWSSGEWTGTMNLTEPQAGSDVGALRTRAVKEGDHYRITGQKIFITYGDHDFTPNIVHMVLARSRRAARNQGHLAVHGAEIPASSRWQPRASATTSAPSASSTSSASMRARPASWPTAIMAAPWAISSARKIAASSACSR